MDTRSYKHKTISVVLATAAMYFGFQGMDLASGLFQMQTFFSLAWYVYFFHLIFLVLMFDLHYKRVRNVHKGLTFLMTAPVFIEALKNRIHHLYHWSYVRRYLNYLIIPTVMYWSVVVLIYLNPFHELFKDGLIILTTGAMAVIYWHLKEVFSYETELKYLSLRLLSLIKLFAAFLAFTALFAVGWYFGINLGLMSSLAFVVAVLLGYQSIFQHKLLSVKALPGLILVGVITVLAFSAVFQTWNVNYYTAGLMTTVVYACCWAIYYHYTDKTLTRALLWEYVFMMVVLVSIILATHDFQGRIH